MTDSFSVSSGLEPQDEASASPRRKWEYMWDDERVDASVLFSPSNRHLKMSECERVVSERGDRRRDGGCEFKKKKKSSQEVFCVRNPRGPVKTPCNTEQTGLFAKTRGEVKVCAAHLTPSAPLMKSCAATWCSLLFLLHSTHMAAACVRLLFAATLWLTPHTTTTTSTSVLPSSPELINTTRSGAAAAPVSHSRQRRAISSRDMNALLDYHNRVRSQVFPPAANMEYMLWDEGLAKSADSWASRCIWDHGPTHVMKYLGQNMSITSGRYRSITDLLRSWYDERHHFSYPNTCRGSLCSHYTQMVWASTNRVGCAVRKCSNMFVFGSRWREVTLLVCNYSIKGNWVGEAPYKTGRPCSVCPSSYGASCWRNQCSPNTKTTRAARY